MNAFVLTLGGICWALAAAEQAHRHPGLTIIFGIAAIACLMVVRRAMR